MNTQLKIHPDGSFIPRYVDAETAATLLGLSEDEFGDLVKELISKRLLKPQNPKRKKYDIKALDRACDRLSGLEALATPTVGSSKKDADTELDEWLAKKNGKG